MTLRAALATFTWVAGRGFLQTQAGRPSCPAQRQSPRVCRPRAPRPPPTAMCSPSPRAAPPMATCRARPSHLTSWLSATRPLTTPTTATRTCTSTLRGCHHTRASVRALKAVREAFSCLSLEAVLLGLREEAPIPLVLAVSAPAPSSPTTSIKTCRASCPWTNTPLLSLSS
jgi:hypothetical protein